ncbi:MAG: hypothetical protein HUU60_06805 [Armatimonadetes bacterium]|nr:hypothetical protein [Armatimonadota bacterium]
MMGAALELFVYDFKRQLRGKAFWDVLLVISAASAVAAIVVLAMTYAWPRAQGTDRILDVLAWVYHGTIVVQGILMLAIVPMVGRSLFEADFGRGLFSHLVITGLPARAVLLARWLTGAALIGIALLCSLPAGVAICKTTIFPVIEYVQSLLIIWLGSIMMLAIVIRDLAHHECYPEADTEGLGADISGKTLKEKRQTPVFGSVILAIVIVGFIYPLTMAMAGRAVPLPIHQWIAPLASLSKNYAATVGGLSFPLIVPTLLLMMGFCIWAIHAAGQRLGEWNDRSYAFCRRFGLILLWLAAYFNAYWYASGAVRSSAEAETAARWSYLFCLILLDAIIMPLAMPYAFGLKGPLMGRIKQPLKGAMWIAAASLGTAFIVVEAIYRATRWAPDRDGILSLFCASVVHVCFHLAFTLGYLKNNVGLNLRAEPAINSVNARWHAERAGWFMSGFVVACMGFALFLERLTAIIPAPYRVIVEAPFWLNPLRPLITGQSLAINALYAGISLAILLYALVQISRRPNVNAE